MKISLQNRSLRWHPFLDFTLLPEALNPSFKNKLLLQKQRSKKWVFIHHYLEESKVKNLYKKLHGLYRVSAAALKAKQEQGVVSKALNPLQEQEWFIEFLRHEVQFFSCGEIWTVLLNMEQRDKYVHYLEQTEDWQPFEIFVQNYWMHALNSPQLVSTFHLAFKEESECAALLELLFRYLSAEQAFELMSSLKQAKPFSQDWELYCKYALTCMRNRQLIKVITLFPISLTEAGLEKLYPCELLEVIQIEMHEIQKKRLIEISLKHYKKWWKNFCHQEIKEAANRLTYLRQE